MPTEPDKRIETQLMAWARKRRTDAGGAFELHPATRKLLHDEIVRTSPKAEEPTDPTAGWMTLLRHRLAFALSVVAVMVVVGVALLPSLSKSKRSSTALAFKGRNEQEDLVMERRSTKTGDEAGKRLSPASTDGQNTAKPASPASTVAARSGTQTPDSKESLSRAYESSKADDSPGKDVSARSDLAQRQSAREPSKLALANKSKEAVRATDDTTLRKRGLAEEQPGLQPAKVGGLGGPNADVGDRGPAVAAPTATPPPATLADSRQVDGRRLETAAATIPQVDQKIQRVNQPGAINAAGEVDRVQGANTQVFSETPTGQAAQRFAQVVKYRRNFNSPPMPNILASFQLEQNGRQVRIVDADGSVYDGATEPAEDAEQTEKRRSVVQSADRDAGKSVESKPETGVAKNEAALNAGTESTANQNLFFRVTGTNRTLNQLVVFQGNFLANANLTNAAVADAAINRVQSNAPTQENQLLPTLQLLNTRIQGQVIIGASDRVEIDASSVSP